MPIIASINTYAYAFVDVPLEAGIDGSDLFSVCTIFQSMLTDRVSHCEFVSSEPTLSIVPIEEGSCVGRIFSTFPGALDRFIAADYARRSFLVTGNEQNGFGRGKGKY
jgi:hypothetical protein